MDNDEGAQSKLQMARALNNLWTQVETRQELRLAATDCLTLLKLRMLWYLDPAMYGI